MSAVEIVAITIAGSGLALLIAFGWRHWRTRRDEADLPRLTSIHAQCIDLVSTLDRYTRGSNVTSIRVTRTISEQFGNALVDAQSIYDAGVRKQAVAALDFRPVSEGADWVDIANPRQLSRTLSELAIELKEQIDPALRHYNASRSRTPGKVRKLRNRLLGSPRGEKWV